MEKLRRVLPSQPDMAALQVLWIAGLPVDAAAALAALARSERVLVNVEDRPQLCDFHSVAEVRRGDLLLTVSTGGASPGLSARIRARLATEFGPEWGERLALLRRAFAETLRDPTLLAEAKPLGIEIRPVSGEALEKLVAQILASPDELAASARAALQPH